MSQSTIENLITVFKIIATIGYLTMSAFIVAIAYRGYSKILKDNEEDIKKYRWAFNIAAVLIVFLLIFIFTLLF